MAAGDEKNPLNQMKLQERQNPSVGQSEPLPTERKASTIPMADFHPAHQDEAAKVGRTLPSKTESTRNVETAERMAFNVRVEPREATREPQQTQHRRNTDARGTKMGAETSRLTPGAKRSEREKLHTLINAVNSWFGGVKLELPFSASHHFASSCDLRTACATYIVSAVPTSCPTLHVMFRSGNTLHRRCSTTR